MVARRADKLAELEAEIKKTYPDVKTATLALDVTDKSAVDNIFDKIPKDLRNVDVLVNNAGGVKGRERVGDVKYEDVEWMLDVRVGLSAHWRMSRLTPTCSSSTSSPWFT